jgi:hypothetical protein
VTSSSWFGGFFSRTTPSDPTPTDTKSGDDLELSSYLWAELQAAVAEEAEKERKNDKSLQEEASRDRDTPHSSTVSIDSYVQKCFSLFVKNFSVRLLETTPSSLCHPSDPTIVTMRCDSLSASVQIRNRSETLTVHSGGR